MAGERFVLSGDQIATYISANVTFPPSGPIIELAGLSTLGDADSRFILVRESGDTEVIANGQFFGVYPAVDDGTCNLTAGPTPLITATFSTPDAYNDTGAGDNYIIFGLFGGSQYAISLEGFGGATDFTVSASDPVPPGGDGELSLTEIRAAVVCFGQGTMIATPQGERPVEELRPGDLVSTADGREVPIVWMGVKAISPRFSFADRLEPVRIDAGALAAVLGAPLPRRDLIVTADHGMILGDCVVNASALVGAPGIDFLDWRRLGLKFCYYHIETECHEIVLAEGAPSETYVDYVARSSFDNYAEYEALYRTERIVPEIKMPRVSSARLLPDTVRERLGIASDCSAATLMDAVFERVA